MSHLPCWWPTSTLKFCKKSYASILAQQKYRLFCWSSASVPYQYTVKKGLRHPRPLPNSPRAGIIKLLRPRESLVRDIPAGDGNIGNLFLRCNHISCKTLTSSRIGPRTAPLMVLRYICCCIRFPIGPPLNYQLPYWSSAELPAPLLVLR